MVRGAEFDVLQANGDLLVGNVELDVAAEVIDRFPRQFRHGCFE